MTQLIKEVRLFAIVIALLGLTSAAEFEVDSMVFPLASDYINISDNADLANYHGSGTANDPYIIEGLSLLEHIGNGIVIRNTDAHVLIRNCTIGDTTGGYYGLYDVKGIRIDDAKNVSVENCRLLGSHGSLSVTGSENILIENYEGNDLWFNGVKNGRIKNTTSGHILVQHNMIPMPSPGKAPAMPLIMTPSENCSIQNCNASVEIILSGPKNCTVEDCYIKDGWLSAYAPVNTDFRNCTVVNATIEIDMPSNMTLENMTLVDLKAVNLAGLNPADLESESYSLLVKGGAANGEAIHYYHNQKGLSLKNLTAGYIWLVDCLDAKVEKAEAGGIFLINSSNSTIEGSKTNQIVLAFSKNILLANNTLRNSSAREAIKLDAGTGNITLHHNIITKNERYFIEKIFASGIDASQSEGNNTFENNIIVGSGYGIQARDNNTLIGNTIANNSIGVKISDGRNHISENNFIYNGVDAAQSSFTNVSFASNLWDGNFWASYEGTQKDNTGVGSPPHIVAVAPPRQGEPTPAVQEPVTDKAPSIGPIG